MTKQHKRALRNGPAFPHSLKVNQKKIPQFPNLILDLGTAGNCVSIQKFY
jgi:hypothetical protein